MTNFDLANGVASGVALAFAFGVPKPQLKSAIGLYLAVLANWWFYVASNEPHGPLEPLWAIGIHLTYDDAWAFIDALTATFAAMAGWVTRAWWFAAVYLIALCQIGFHIAYWTYQAMSEPTYYQSLNVLFWGILSASIFAGGKGVKDRIVRGCAALGSAYRARIAKRGFRSASRLAWPE